MDYSILGEEHILFLEILRLRKERNCSNIAAEAATHLFRLGCREKEAALIARTLDRCGYIETVFQKPWTTIEITDRGLNSLQAMKQALVNVQGELAEERLTSVAEKSFEESAEEIIEGLRVAEIEGEE